MNLLSGIFAFFIGGIYGVVGMYLGAAFLGAGHGTGFFVLMFVGIHNLALILWPICAVVAALAPKSLVMRILRVVTLAHYGTLYYYGMEDERLSQAFGLDSVTLMAILFFLLGQIFIWWPRLLTDLTDASDSK